MDKQQDKGALGYAKAALEGTNIVVASIFGSTVTTCVVFIPLVFLNGMSGQMFGAMGYTIVFCMCGLPAFRDCHCAAVLYDVQAEGAFLCAGDPSSDLPAGRLPEDHAGPFKT